ncbi:MAG: site-specific DNA-methyltransferase [Gammaproteobacteria bacterium]|nr:site-specific DNA-methyltransferase [Gammaproteobacteria bacterium]
MPTLEFKGKQIIYAHHLTVPVRALDAHPAKSFPPQKSPPELDGNLIIHGDNLHALKALLPRYAGRVHCIYIDPPYNTGNEKWIYNDNVNSPQMRDWLKGKNPVDGEDLERHDKWLCMMWPRLHLLRELLAEDGVIFVSIDDNEQHRLRLVMDEIFGEENFLAQISWQGMDTIKNDAKYFSSNSEFINCYAKNLESSKIAGFQKTEKQRKVYSNKDNDPRGPYLLTPLHAKSGTEKNVYEFRFPNGQLWKPPAGRYPVYSQATLKRLIKEKRLWLDPAGKKVPQKKTYLSEVGDRMRPHTFWRYEDFGSTRQANAELRAILGRGEFANPKPSKLVRAVIDLVAKEDSIILDSFAGSATTAHAVLALNKSDGGNRKFILVECENYADKITAERVRRVIKGVSTAKDPALKAGLGGRFTYCTLGEEINAEKMLTGENLPDYETLARHLVWLNTGDSPKNITQRKDGFFYETNSRLYHLIYEPNLEFLRSADSALDGDRADRIAKKVAEKGKPAVVFAAAKYVGQKELTKMNITFAALPFAVEGVV